MTSILIRTDAVVNIDGADFSAGVGSTASLNSSRVPYAMADITLPFLDDELVDWLNPFDGRRVPVTMTIDGGDRVFDLGLRARPVDHAAKTITLSLASDEAILQRYTALSTDDGARAHEDSIRGVVDYVLDKIGASLEPGTDADVTAYWPVTQLLPNPSFEIDTSGWALGFNSTSLTRVGLVTPPAIQGGFGGRWIAGAGASNLQAGPNATTFAVTPGKSYVWAFYIYSGNVVNSQAVLQWYASNGSVFVGETRGSVITTSTSAFNRAYVIAQAPAGATHMWPYAGTTGNGGGGAHIVDGGLLYEGTELIDYFDGATTDSSTYTYDWTGDVDNSPSAREPVLERLPELFTWKPGVTAWDFLMAITSSAGMVLWCDEARDWFLAYPEDRTIGTQINLPPSITRSGVDELSADDDRAAVSGVVVRYAWTDADGVAKTATDSAGDPDIVAVIDLAAAYPGPGAAAAILARRQGTGRVQSISAVTTLGTTPGMSAQISLDGAPNTLGRITAVTFDLTAGYMDIETSGLVSITDGDWLGLDPDLDWDDEDPDLDWEDV